MSELSPSVTPTPAPNSSARSGRARWERVAARFRRSGAQAQAGAHVTWRAALIEWAVMLVAVYAFCAGFMDLGTRRPLRGNEGGIFQALDWVLVNSLQQFGQFPQWNPFLKQGLPYVSDPFLHVWNPFVTLPVLIWGVWDGYKIAVFLAFVMCALGAWWLGKVLGVGSFSRVWLGLSYAFTGRIVAQFFQGQYDLIFGLAWVPWTLAAWFALMQTRRPRELVIAAVALALVILSGNGYYAYYMVFVAALFGAVAVTKVTRKPFSISLRYDVAVVLLAAGLLAVALSAIYLAPFLELFPSLGKTGDPQLQTSHSLAQIWLDYTSTEPFREDTRTYPQETYAYIGYAPFAALLLLPLAWRAHSRRAILFFVLLFLFTLLFVAVKETPLRDVYARVNFVNQFRYPTRFLVLGALALLALAALGFDAVFKKWNARFSKNFLTAARKRAGVWIVAGAVAALMLYALADVFWANKGIAISFGAYPIADRMTAQLRALDPTPYYVSNPYGWNMAMAEQSLRYLDTFYGFELKRETRDSITQRALRVEPKYLVLEEGRPLNYPDPQVVAAFETLRIYRLPHSLPFAFLATDATLHGQGKEELKRAQVQELEPYYAGPNTLEFILRADAPATLVVMTQSYTGWRVTRDGKPAPLLNVNGYLGARLETGLHKYVFEYNSDAFKIGIVITLLTLLALGGLWLWDARGAWNVGAWLEKIRARLPQGLPPVRQPVPQIRVAAPTIPSTSAPPVARAADPTLPSAPLSALPPPPADTVAPIQIPAPSLPPLPTLDTPTPVTPNEDWGPRRFTFARRENKYVAQARNVGKYAAVKFTIALPREWWQRGATGKTARVETRAVLKSFARAETLPWLLFGLALVVYAFTRFYKLDEFPISFLGDEAVVVTLARELLANGLRDPKAGWFPLYFNFFFVVNPLISVYLQAAAIPIFGVTIAGARFASALLTVFGAAAVAFTLKSFFQARYWWTAILFLAITPTWFFHSRTVFDTVTATALYGILIFCYLLYRYRSPRYVFVVALAGAAVFYSYPAAQLILALTAVLLGLSDLRYHLQNIRWWLYALPLIAVMLIPYARFALQHPEESWYHLRSVNSYVVDDLPLTEKVTGFITRYAQGISPLYWFTPNDLDLVRHRMKDYAHLPLITLPLLVVGVGVCLARFRESKYRVVLIALVSAPFAAALVDVLILRLLAFVIPATLLAVLGMEWLLNHFAKRLSTQVLSVLLLIGLSFGGIWMTRDALVYGPTWFETYDLYGMQWGAKQLFQVLQKIRAASPKSPIVITPSWANGTEEFIEFFMPNEKQIQTRTIGAWIENQEPLSRNTIFVMTPNELQEAQDSGRFQEPQFVWQLKYPNDTRAFEIVRMAYVDNIDEIFRAEKEERAKPVTEQIQLNGETVTMIHSQFDSGKALDMFDGDSYTLARGREANPLLIEFDYPTPRALSSLYASFGQMRFTIRVSLFAPDSDKPVVYTETVSAGLPLPEVAMKFENAPALVKRVRVEIEHLDSPGEAKIHVRELQLK